MKIQDKVVVVTGGASGIGRGLCRRFAAEGAKGIVVSDYNGEGAAKVAKEIGGLAVTADVGKEADIQKLVEIAISSYGPIDLFCSNAAVGTCYRRVQPEGCLLPLVQHLMPSASTPLWPSLNGFQSPMPIMASK